MSYKHTYKDQIAHTHHAHTYCKHNHMCTRVYTYTHMHTYTHTHAHLHTHTHTCTHTRTHTCTHTHTHAHTHTHLVAGTGHRGVLHWMRVFVEHTEQSLVNSKGGWPEGVCAQYHWHRMVRHQYPQHMKTPLAMLYELSEPSKRNSP